MSASALLGSADVEQERLDGDVAVNCGGLPIEFLLYFLGTVASLLCPFLWPLLWSDPVNQVDTVSDTSRNEIELHELRVHRGEQVGVVDER